MKTAHPIDRLVELSRSFGSDPAGKKLELLKEIARLDRFDSKRIVKLHDTLYFMRAYPDNEKILSAVTDMARSLRTIIRKHTGDDEDFPAFVNTGLPGSCNRHSYSFEVLRRLAEMFPGSLEIDWPEVSYEPTFVDALNLAVLPAESRGLEDEYMGLRDWLQQCKTDPAQTDLEIVLAIFESSSLSPRQQVHVFESCEYPVLYRLREHGSARCEVEMPPRRPHYQRSPFSGVRFPLKPKIVQPLERRRKPSPVEGRKLLDLSLAALCSRNLEIHPLIYANPEDVVIADVGRGLQVLLAGMKPRFRSVVESDFFFLILKNGLPISYGPASVFLGCCEMGINLFPEFRGGEIRYIYSQFMRVLYHVASVRYFFLTSYGMGDGNPEAIKSGAFWFYRKLGFRAANPEVESLAREEEAIMRRRPGYRSSTATLRELSLTDAYFDLSGGRCRPVNFEKLGHAVTRFVTNEFGGDRRKAERAAIGRLSRVLNVGEFHSWTPDERAASRRIAPVMALLPGLADWPAGEKRKLAAAIRAKGETSQFEYVRKVDRVGRLQDGLHEVARSGE
ncbi:MAG: hypothetical protein PVF33_01985 [Candidatus Latescibacterota bacterium]|jgi:hypothetical protein